MVHPASAETRRGILFVFMSKGGVVFRDDYAYVPVDEVGEYDI